MVRACSSVPMVGFGRRTAAVPSGTLTEDEGPSQRSSLSARPWCELGPFIACHCATLSEAAAPHVADQPDGRVCRCASVNDLGLFQPMDRRTIADQLMISPRSSALRAASRSRHRAKGYGDAGADGVGRGGSDTIWMKSTTDCSSALSAAELPG